MRWIKIGFPVFPPAAIDLYRVAYNQGNRTERTALRSKIVGTLNDVKEERLLKRYENGRGWVRVLDEVGRVKISNRFRAKKRGAHQI